MEFNLPNLIVEWNKLEYEIYVNSNQQNNGVNVKLNRDCFDFFLKKTETREALIIGSPVINNKVDPEGLSNLLLYGDLSNEIIKKINGQFLILVSDKKHKILKIINDRFNSHHFYYADLEKKFIGSFLYFDLFKKIRLEKNFKINSNNILQFLWMSRVMGDGTYDNFSFYMLPANILTISKGNLKKDIYWRPNFEKKIRSKKQAGNTYIDLLKKSIQRLTNENKSNKYGYFFSSGLDSRTVATAISLNNKKLDSYTLAFSNNLEVKYAKRAAELTGSKHHFIKLENDHFEKNFISNVIICGGMYSVHDALFTGLKRSIKDKVDVVFHGHALDFWHYGNYLPSYFVKIFGSQTFIRKLLNFDNIVDTYFKYNPLRLTWTDKSLDLKKIFNESHYSESINSIKNSILKDIKSGQDICNNKLDQWEYLMLHAFGRHFTNINITSKLTSAKVRTPAFDNDILDFYTSIPAKQRLTDEIRIYALNNIGPKVGNIPSANHGFLAGDSHITKTFKLITRKLKRMITGNFKYTSPSLKDRTWPELNTYFRNSKYLLSELDKVFENEELIKSLYMIDWEYLRLKIEKWKRGEKFDAIFLFSLITINQFFILTK